MGTRSVPLWLLFASGCAPDPSSGDVPEEGLFEGRGYQAERLAERLTDAWLAEKERAALTGVHDVHFQQVTLDALGMAHVRLQQTEGGVSVFGGEAIVHLRPNGEVASMTT